MAESPKTPEEEGEKPRIKPIIEGAESLSLGVSMVVAVLMGVGIGLGLKYVTGITWTLWIGVAIGIAAAVLNVYKAYSKQYKEFEELRKSGRYKIQQQLEDDEDEDESEKNY